MHPDPRVLRSLDALTVWLEAHAPELGMPLAGPVAAREVTRVEQLLRAPLPADYLTFLKRHDGQRLVPSGENAQSAPFVRGLELLPLGASRSEYQVMMGDWGEEGPGDIETQGPVRALYKHDRWLPIVLIFGSSEYLCLDLDPLPGGTPGQVIWISMKDERRRVVAPSFAVLLERLTEALRSAETVVEEEIELPDHLFDQLVGSE